MDDLRMIDEAMRGLRYGRENDYRIIHTYQFCSFLRIAPLAHSVQKQNNDRTDVSVQENHCTGIEHQSSGYRYNVGGEIRR